MNGTVTRLRHDDEFSGDIEVQSSISEDAMAVPYSVCYEHCADYQCW